MLLRPPYLQPGDRVVILSTARRIDASELETAISVLSGWGLEVTLGRTIGLADHQFAGTDAERLADLQQAINDPSIRAIICARGGYGTVRIMDDIDWTGMLSHPKWLVGYSDITYLHIHLNQTLGIQTIHGPMPIQFATNTHEALDSLHRELAGKHTPTEIDAHPLNRPGDAKGILIGGNLSILYSITGTKSGFNTVGKILFIEDIDEQLYHIDRMMLNLKRSGKLQELAGLIVGGMTDMKDNAVPFGMTAEEIIKSHVEEFDYPVCFRYPAGHIADNRALVMGRISQMSVGDKSTLI